MKFIRILMSIILLLILIAVFAMGCLIYFINPNKLKPVITAEVKKESGYDLTIDGKLSWTFYPTLGISIPHMTLRAPLQTTTFADLRDITIATDLLKLIKGVQKLEGDIHVNEVKLMNMNLQSAHIGAHWQNKVLTLAPFSAKLYNGNLDGVIHGAELSTTPRWDINIQAKQIQVKPLLDDLNGADSKIKITGVGDISLQAEAMGKTKNDLLSSSNGTLVFGLNNGTVEGVDINYLIQTADALANKQPLSAPANFKQTTFQSFTGSMNIKKGIAQTDNLLLVSSSFNTKGQGELNLIRQTINLNLQVSAQNTTKFKGTIPVIVDGDIHNPSVRLDMTAIDTQIVKEQLEKAKTKLEEKVKGLPDKANKFLQKFLGQ